MESLLSINNGLFQCGYAERPLGCHLCETDCEYGYMKDEYQCDDCNRCRSSPPEPTYVPAICNVIEMRKCVGDYITEITNAASSMENFCSSDNDIDATMSACMRDANCQNIDVSTTVKEDICSGPSSCSGTMTCIETMDQTDCSSIYGAGTCLNGTLLDGCKASLGIYSLGVYMVNALGCEQGSRCDETEVMECLSEFDIDGVVQDAVYCGSLMRISQCFTKHTETCLGFIVATYGTSLNGFETIFTIGKCSATPACPLRSTPESALPCPYTSCGDGYACAESGYCCPIIDECGECADLDCDNGMSDDLDKNGCPLCECNGNENNDQSTPGDCTFEEANCPFDDCSLGLDTDENGCRICQCYSKAPPECDMIGGMQCVENLVSGMMNSFSLESQNAVDYCASSSASQNMRALDSNPVEIFSQCMNVDSKCNMEVTVPETMFTAVCVNSGSPERCDAHMKCVNDYINATDHCSGAAVADCISKLDEDLCPGFMDSSMGMMLKMMDPMCVKEGCDLRTFGSCKQSSEVILRLEDDDLDTVCGASNEMAECMYEYTPTCEGDKLSMFGMTDLYVSRMINFMDEHCWEDKDCPNLDDCDLDCSESNGRKVDDKECELCECADKECPIFNDCDLDCSELNGRKIDENNCELCECEDEGCPILDDCYLDCSGSGFNGREMDENNCELCECAYKECPILDDCNLDCSGFNGRKMDENNCELCECKDEACPSLDDCNLDCSERNGRKMDENICELCECNDQACSNLDNCDLDCSERNGRKMDENSCELCECNDDACPALDNCNLDCSGLNGRKMDENNCQLCECNDEACPSLDDCSIDCSERNGRKMDEINCELCECNDEACPALDNCNLDCSGLNGRKMDESNCKLCECNDEACPTLDDCSIDCSEHNGRKMDENNCELCECNDAACSTLIDCNLDCSGLNGRKLDENNCELCECNDDACPALDNCNLDCSGLDGRKMDENNCELCECNAEECPSMSSCSLNCDELGGFRQDNNGCAECQCVCSAITCNNDCNGLGGYQLDNNLCQTCSCVLPDCISDCTNVMDGKYKLCSSGSDRMPCQSYGECKNGQTNIREGACTPRDGRSYAFYPKLNYESGNLFGGSCEAPNNVIGGLEAACGTGVTEDIQALLDPRESGILDLIFTLAIAFNEEMNDPTTEVYQSSCGALIEICIKDFGGIPGFSGCFVTAQPATSKKRDVGETEFVQQVQTEGSVDENTIKEIQDIAQETLQGDLELGDQTVAVSRTPEIIIPDANGQSQAIPVDEPIDLCMYKKDQCVHGECMIAGDKAVCVCDQDYDGEFCDLKLDTSSGEDDSRFDDIKLVAIIVGVVILVLVLVAICFMYKTRANRPVKMIESTLERGDDKNVTLNGFNGQAKMYSRMNYVNYAKSIPGSNSYANGGYENSNDWRMLNNTSDGYITNDRKEVYPANTTRVPVGGTMTSQPAENPYYSGTPSTPSNPSYNQDTLHGTVTNVRV